MRYERTDGQLHLDLDEGLLQLDLAGGRNEEYPVRPGRRGRIRAAGHRPLREPRPQRHGWPGPPSWCRDCSWCRPGSKAARQWQQDWYRRRGGTPSANRTTGAPLPRPPWIWPHGPVQVAPAWRWQRTRDDFPPVPPFPWLPEEEAVGTPAGRRVPVAGRGLGHDPGQAVPGIPCRPHGAPAHLGRAVRAPRGHRREPRTAA